jgi:hypothetical protein
MTTVRTSRSIELFQSDVQPVLLGVALDVYATAVITYIMESSHSMFSIEFLFRSLSVDDFVDRF